MKIKIKQATSKDLPGLIALENKCFATDRLTLKEYQHYLETKGKVFIAVYAEQLIASALILVRKDGTACRLYSFAVLPKFRGNQIGLLVFRAVERFVKRYRIPKMTLEVAKTNANAIRFYKRSGFKTFSTYKHYYADGDDALRMQKLYTE